MIFIYKRCIYSTAGNDTRHAWLLQVGAGGVTVGLGWVDIDFSPSAARLVVLRQRGAWLNSLGTPAKLRNIQI